VWTSKTVSPAVPPPRSVRDVDDHALDEETVEWKRQAVDHARARGDVAGERDDPGGGHEDAAVDDGDDRRRVRRDLPQERSRRLRRKGRRGDLRLAGGEQPDVARDARREDERGRVGAVAPGGGADRLAGVEGGAEPGAGLQVEAVVEGLGVEVRGLDLGNPGGVMLDSDPPQKPAPKGAHLVSGA